jgi:TRAP-type C4-dicarboxylate transport system substrate-binding protein
VFCNKIAFTIALLSAAAAGGAMAKAAAEVRHFSFAYDQPHTTAYGIAADTFANKLKELSHGTMIIDQFPGAQLGQEPQVLQKLRTGDIDFRAKPGSLPSPIFWWTSSRFSISVICATCRAISRMPD